MGAPILNYQNPDSTWTAYTDEWAQVGGAKIWRSNNGKEAVYADSTGRFYARRGTHWLGLLPPQLVKFSLTDSSYAVLASAAPDSVTMTGNVITFWRIFYGVNLRAKNNPKVIRLTGLEWEFTQAARDSLAKLTPWANWLLATVHRVDADSLGAVTWKDRGGGFSHTIKGRLTSGWMNLDDGGVRIWTLPKSFIATAETTTTIPVWKRMALVGGAPFFFEAFSPIQTAGLPLGSLYHDLKFGHDTGLVTGNVNIENTPAGIRTSPATSGTLDSIAAMLDDGIADHNVTPSLRDWITRTLITGGCATEKIIPTGAVDTWYYFTGVNASITAGGDYWLNIWGNATGGTVSLNKGGSGADSSMFDFGDTYTSACPTLTGSKSGGTNWWLIYAFYTEPAPATGTGRRRRILGTGLDTVYLGTTEVERMR